MATLFKEPECQEIEYPVHFLFEGKHCVQKSVPTNGNRSREPVLQEQHARIQ